MMIFAKLSTAKTIVFGPVLDADGAEYTGAVVADVKISKNNGTPAALNGSATLTHKEVGIYELALTAADISAVGVLVVTLSKTTYLAPPIALNVLPAAVYDSLVGGSDKLSVKLADAVDHGGSTATLRLGANGATAPFLVVNSGGNAAEFISGNGNGLSLEGTDAGLHSISGSEFGYGIFANGATGIYANVNGIVWNPAWDAEILKPMVRTTIATVNSQTSVTLGGGSSDDNAYKGWAIIQDAADPSQRSVVGISSFTGSTRTLTFTSAPAFTISAGDQITIVGVDSAGTTVADVTVVSSTLATITAALATILNSIGAFTGSGVNTILGFLKAIMSKAASTPSDVGGTFAAATDSLEAIEEDLEANGLGTGARTVTPTVLNSLAAPIEGAIIRFTKGAESYSGTTDVNGQVASFNLDDGTWTVAITAVGYSFAGTTLVVNGTETPTYTMTTNSVSAPAAPNLSIGTLLCLGTDGLPEEGVEIKVRMTVGPGDDGYSLDAEEFTTESDTNGEVEIPHVQGAQYSARRGDVGREVSYTVPAASSFTLPENLGAP